MLKFMVGIIRSGRYFYNVTGVHGSESVESKVFEVGGHVVIPSCRALGCRCLWAVLLAGGMYRGGVGDSKGEPAETPNTFRQALGLKLSA